METMFELKAIIIFLSSLVLMELIAMLAHRYIMHGFGWKWHRDHHLPGPGKLEVNDLYAVIITVLCIGLFLFSGGPQSLLWWMALGITIYGLLYAFVHDGLVHRRWPLQWKPQHPYLRRLIEAHHLHHAVKEKHGAVSYGFLYAPASSKLRAQLKAQRQK